MILAFLGFVFNYSLRVNINLVITSMVNQTALDIQQGIYNYSSNSTSSVSNAVRNNLYIFHFKISRMDLLFGIVLLQGML